MRQSVVLLIGLLCVAVLAPAAWASTAPPPADTLKVDYFSNANTGSAPDGTLRLTDPNTNGGVGVFAAIYVFDPEQELTECCECFLSPDGLRTLSVNSDLTANPLTPVTLTTGLIKIVSTTGTSGSKLFPTPAIRSWTTHIQNGSFSETESASQDATLSSAEVSRLQSECSAIQITGSGHGLCTCGTGD
jgi:hypothetical protein